MVFFSWFLKVRCPQIRVKGFVDEMWPGADSVWGDVIGDAVPLESCGEEEIVDSVLFA